MSLQETRYLGLTANTTLVAEFILFSTSGDMPLCLRLLCFGHFPESSKTVTLIEFIGRHPSGMGQYA
jgi:hypothetical protein